MSLSPEHARAALQAATAAEQRSTRLYRDFVASPYLLLWGCIWAIAFALSQWQPRHAGLIWMVLDGIGIAGSLMLAWRHRDPAQPRAFAWQAVAIGTALFVFFASIFWILRPTAPEQVAAVVALTFAALYALAGAASGSGRFVATGAVLAVVTLGGYVLLHDYFFVWMALAGGGALVAGGLWLKRI